MWVELLLCLLHWHDMTGLGIQDDAPEDRWSTPILSQIELHGWNYTYAPVMAYIDGVVSDSFWWENEELLFPGLYCCLLP